MTKSPPPPPIPSEAEQHAAKVAALAVANALAAEVWKLFAPPKETLQ